MNVSHLYLFIFLQLLSVFLFSQETDSITDPRDGKSYKTVKINDQVWLAENLAFKADSGCYIYKNDEKNLADYGYIYDWKTANNVCPVGWHLPSDQEWLVLEDFLGGTATAGCKMKDTESGHWKSINEGANNESGFSARAGGFLFSGGNYLSQGVAGYWWTSTKSLAQNAYCYRFIQFSKCSVGRDYSTISCFSVRCVKD